MKASSSRTKGAVRFVVWALCAAAVVFVAARSYTSGQMSSWFYHRAAADGYAVNADGFRDATKEAPAVLRIVEADQIEGLVAVKVKKGDLLPRNANGIITTKVLDDGKRAVVEGTEVKVMVPWEIQQAKGFKFKDTFKHKGIQTWPWSAAWNVMIVFLLGLSLGLMAEGFTDMIGIKVEKIVHHGH
jgi:hypothetical protein